MRGLLLVLESSPFWASGSYWLLKLLWRYFLRLEGEIRDVCWFLLQVVSARRRSVHLPVLTFIVYIVSPFVPVSISLSRSILIYIAHNIPVVILLPRSYDPISVSFSLPFLPLASSRELGYRFLDPHKSFAFSFPIAAEPDTLPFFISAHIVPVLQIHSPIRFAPIPIRNGYKFLFLVGIRVPVLRPQLVNIMDP